jgi:hypothetical protein
MHACMHVGMLESKACRIESKGRGIEAEEESDGRGEELLSVCSLSLSLSKAPRAVVTAT